MNENSKQFSATPPSSVSGSFPPEGGGSGSTPEDRLAAFFARPEMAAEVEKELGGKMAVPAKREPAEPGAKPLTPIEAAKAGTPFSLTDLGNAERLVSNYGKGFRWDGSSRCWRAWDGRRWVSDDGVMMHRLAAKTARKIKDEAAAISTADDTGRRMAEAVFKHAIKSESREKLAACVEVAKAIPGVSVPAGAWDSDPWILNVKNGILDLRTGELRPHNMKRLLTKLAPVDYVAGATCPRFNQFLVDATGGDRDLARYLQKMCGYLMTGDTSEEKAWLWYGGTATGKSTLLEAVRGVLGDYARTINPLMLCRQTGTNSGAATPELAALHGCRLAAGSELESGKQLGESFMKGLTGGEGITARHLYGAQFEFLPQFKIVLALNHCPRASSDDGAVWRRLVRVGLDRTVPPEKRDRTLKPYLRNPDGGAVAVLAWMMAGCLAWQREGLDPVPESVKLSSMAYRTECDPLAAFFEDYMVFDAREWTSAASIVQAYKEHLDETGTNPKFRLSPKRIGETLKEKGCSTERRHAGRGWLGVALKSASVSDVSDVTDVSRLFPTKEFTRESLVESVTSVTSDTHVQKPAPIQAIEEPEKQPMTLSAEELKEMFAPDLP